MTGFFALPVGVVSHSTFRSHNMRSPNFQFLAKHDEHLLRLAMQAEGFCFSDPDITLTRARQLVEAIGLRVLHLSGGTLDDRPNGWQPH